MGDSHEPDGNADCRTESRALGRLEVVALFIAVFVGLLVLLAPGYVVAVGGRAFAEWIAGRPIDLLTYVKASCANFSVVAIFAALAAYILGACPERPWLALAVWFCGFVLGGWVCGQLLGLDVPGQVWFAATGVFRAVFWLLWPIALLSKADGDGAVAART